MPLTVERITPQQAAKIVNVQEGQFYDVKAIEVSPAKLTKAMSAFANSDGGDLYVGITETGASRTRGWAGFINQEAANGHIQCFEDLFPIGSDFDYEFLRCDAYPGLVLHVQINKTQDIRRATTGMPYVRRGAQSLPVDSPEKLRRLEYTKGLVSFETELVSIPVEMVTDSEVVKDFIRQVVPSSTPEAFLRKQVLLRNSSPTVGGAILFADEPQALIPKRCGIKVYRYKTKEEEGFRDALAFTPHTVEGCLYNQIRDAVRLTTEVIESIPKMGMAGLESVSYPQEALHEIITNAVIHRDYSIADDIHIRVFDNRVEVQSPGRLPAHVTIDNILKERFARNGAVVRILNKFPDPPNKDVGEGLNTAFEAMTKLGLKEPAITESDSSVLVIIKHEPLASPEEAILDYLQNHPTINNKIAREITHLTMDYRVKALFKRMVKSGLIEQVPGTRTSNTAFRRPVSVESQHRLRLLRQKRSPQKRRPTRHPILNRRSPVACLAKSNRHFR